MSDSLEQWLLDAENRALEAQRRADNSEDRAYWRGRETAFREARHQFDVQGRVLTDGNW